MHGPVGFYAVDSKKLMQNCHDISKNEYDMNDSQIKMMVTKRDGRLSIFPASTMGHLDHLSLSKKQLSPQSWFLGLHHSL